jgi:hypothetical protein
LSQFFLYTYKYAYGNGRLLQMTESTPFCIITLILVVLLVERH